MNGKLTDALVHELDEPGKHGDGLNGLYLRVTPSGSRQWVQRIVVRGRRRDFGLGGYPLVTLSEARIRALVNRRVARSGGDPSETPWPLQAAGTGMSAAADPARAAPPAAPKPEEKPRAPLLREAMEEVIKLHKPRWKNGEKQAAHWRNSLNVRAMPAIGDRRVDEITAQDIADILAPIWITKAETARRMRQRLGVIMSWAAARGFRADNPAEACAALLPRFVIRRTHYAALNHADVAAALRAVSCSAASESTRRAFAWIVLTACRSGEARGARISEIDRGREVWTVPPERTKTGSIHRVPLSSGAIRVLDAAEPHPSGLLFPSPRGGLLSDATVSKLLRERGIAAVPHGFRSSFRDWASEVAECPREVAELALGHVAYGAVEGAYARSDLLEQRRPLMQSWCDYVGGSAVC